jgi:hypothetical protein
VTLAFLEAVLRSDASKEKWIPVERVVEPL